MSASTGEGRPGSGSVTWWPLRGPRGTLRRPATKRNGMPSSTRGGTRSFGSDLLETLGDDFAARYELMRNPATTGSFTNGEQMSEEEIIAREPKGGGDFVKILAPDGLQPAVCCDVVDQGEEYDERYGKTKHNISIHFLLHELMPAQWQHPKTGDIAEVPEHLVDEPFMATRWFNNTLAEKGHLRPFLESWRNKDFTAEELSGFNVVKVIGAPTLLQLRYKQKSNGEWRTEIVNALPLPEGYPRVQIPETYVRFKDREPREPKSTPQAAPQAPSGPAPAF